MRTRLRLKAKYLVWSDAADRKWLLRHCIPCLHCVLCRPTQLHTQLHKQLRTAASTDRFSCSCPTLKPRTRPASDDTFHPLAASSLSPFLVYDFHRCLRNRCLTPTHTPPPTGAAHTHSHTHSHSRLSTESLRRFQLRQTSGSPVTGEWGGHR